MIENCAPLIRTMIFISGDSLEHAALTQIFEISPSEIGAKGQLGTNGKTIHSETYWKYSKDIYDYSISDALKSLLVEILPHKEHFNEYVKAKELEVCLICNVTIIEDRPIYQIEKEVINMLSSIDAEFIMDIFDYSD